MGRMTEARKRAKGKTAAAPPGTGTGTVKIALPASGLAADILAMADAATVSHEMTAATIAPATPEPAAAAARSHNISFFASPVREERKAAEATEHLATFFLSREEYGVDVRLVQEIIRVSEITPGLAAIAATGRGQPRREHDEDTQDQATQPVGTHWVSLDERATADHQSTNR